MKCWKATGRSNALKTNWLSSAIKFISISKSSLEKLVLIDLPCFGIQIWLETTQFGLKTHMPQNVLFFICHLIPNRRDCSIWFV